MIRPKLKDLKKINNIALRYTVEKLIEEKLAPFEQYFKRYPQKVPFEIFFTKKNKGWKITIEIEMSSQTIHIEESGKDLISTITKAFRTAKQNVKKIKKIESKDYTYKRAKYRKNKFTQEAFEKLVIYKNTNNRTQFDLELKNIYEDLIKDIEENMLAKGKNKSEAETISKNILSKVKEDVFRTFDSQNETREDFLDSISDISFYHESKA